LLEEKLGLIALLVGLYLADCAILLRPTQALAIISVPCRWPFRILRRRRHTQPPWSQSPIHLNFGLTFYPMRGSFPTFLNPLTPAVAAFKTIAALPSIQAASNLGTVPMHRIVGARLLVRSLTPMLLTHAVLLYIAVPLHLLHGMTESLLITVGVIFLSAAAIIGFSYPLVKILRLRKSAYWSLAAQAIICVPLSLNFPRKLALMAATSSDAQGFMSRVPQPERWTTTQDFITALEYARTGATEVAESLKAASLAEGLRRELPDE
jgi:hypothetical protein